MSSCRVYCCGALFFAFLFATICISPEPAWAANESKAAKQAESKQKDKQPNSADSKEKAAKEDTNADAPNKADDADSGENEGTKVDESDKTDSSAEDADSGPSQEGAVADAPEEASDDETSKEAEGEDDAPEPAEPEMITLKSAPLKLELDVEGAFGATKIHPVAVKGKTWSSFKIVETVEHGQEVEKGDPLLQFDPKDIDRSIADREREMRLSEISLLEAEASLRALERSMPIRVAQTEAEKEQAEQDFARYFKIYQDLTRESAERSLRSARHTLEYEKAELDQLEKMYEADDLTEETEELILVRQRRAVEAAEFSLRRAEIYHEETMNLDLPRAEQARKWSARLRDFSYESTKKTMPLELDQARLSFERQKVQFERAQEQFEELKSDRDLMTILAPATGVVYFGAYKNGSFSGSSIESKLLPEKVLSSSDTVILSIVEPRPLVVEGTFPEKELHRLSAGQKAEITPVGYPDLELAGSVETIDTIPAPDGRFHLALTVEAGESAERIMPGLKCKAKIILYQNDEALLVPEKAVKTVEEDGKEKHFVFVPGKGKKKVKRSVELGKRQGDKVEILRGVKAGQKIFATCPE